MFEPEKLHLVTDKSAPAFYDERIHLPISEAMVLNIMDRGVWSRLSSGKTLKAGWPVVDGRQRGASAPRLISAG